MNPQTGIARISRWVSDSLTDTNKTEDGKRPCSRLDLVHVQGEVPREVYFMNLGAGQQDPQKVAELFYDIAQRHVEELVGVHTFNMRAFYGAATFERHIVFLVNVTKDQGAQLSTENPDERGQIQARMRREEMLIQQVYAKQAHLDAVHARAIEQAHRNEFELRGQINEMQTVMFDMMGRWVTQNNAHEMAKAQYERETRLMDRGMKLIPSAVNAVAGTEVFPQSDEDTALIELLAERFADKAEQLPMILGGMGVPKEGIALMVNRVHKFIRDKEEEEKKFRELNPTLTSDGLADLRGEADEEPSNVRSLLPRGKK
jgi:hypothetical protein